MPTVISDKFAQRLQLFFEKNKDAVPAPPEDTKQLEAESSSSSTVPGEQEEEEEAKPLNASATDLPYDLCSNRIRRNFLRHYLVQIKRKKESVALNSDEILVSSIPFLNGTIEVELRPNGYFETYLVGRDRRTRLPLDYELVPSVPDNGACNDPCRGRVNALPRDVTRFTMYIAEKHAIRWFLHNNKYRRISNRPIFEAQSIRWANSIKEKHAATKREVDRMIEEAKRLGLTFSSKRKNRRDIDAKPQSKSKESELELRE